MKKIVMIPCQFSCWVTSCNESWFVLCQFDFPWIRRENSCYEPTFFLPEHRTLLIKALLCFSTCKDQHPQASTGFCTKDTSIWLTTNIALGFVPTFQLHHQGINLQSRNSPVKFVKIWFPSARGNSKSKRPIPSSMKPMHPFSPQETYCPQATSRAWPIFPSGIVFSLTPFHLEAASFPNPIFSVGNRLFPKLTFSLAIVHL